MYREYMYSKHIFCCSCSILFKSIQTQGRWNCKYLCASMHPFLSHYYIAYSFIKHKHIQIFGCGILDCFLSGTEWSLSSASLSKDIFLSLNITQCQVSDFVFLACNGWQNCSRFCFLCLFSFSVLTVSVSSAYLLLENIMSKVYTVCSKRAIQISYTL